MNNYIEISITGVIGGAKRFDFTKIFNPYVFPEAPQEWAATLNNGTTSSSGVAKRYWKVECPVRYTDSRGAPYGSITDVAAIFAFTGVIIFRDWLTSTSYNVIQINRSNPKEAVVLRSATIDSPNSLSMITFEFKEV